MASPGSADLRQMACIAITRSAVGRARPDRASEGGGLEPLRPHRVGQPQKDRLLLLEVGDHLRDPRQPLLGLLDDPVRVPGPALDLVGDRPEHLRAAAERPAPALDVPDDVLGDLSLRPHDPHPAAIRSTLLTREVYAGRAARNCTRAPPSTRTASKPARRSRSGSAAGSRRTMVSWMWSRRNTTVPPALSLPARTPPGRSTRQASASSRYCRATEGTWWSMVKQTTPEKLASGQGIAVPSP